MVIRKITVLVPALLITSQVCFSGHLASQVERTKRQLIKNRMMKKYMNSDIQVNSLSQQLQNMHYNEKLNLINEEKNLMLSRMININTQGYVGPYMVSNLIYVNGTMTPLGKLHIQQGRIGMFYINSGLINQTATTTQPGMMGNPMPTSMPMTSTPPMGGTPPVPPPAPPSGTTTPPSANTLPPTNYPMPQPTMPQPTNQTMR